MPNLGGPGPKQQKKNHLDFDFDDLVESMNETENQGKMDKFSNIEKQLKDQDREDKEGIKYKFNDQDIEEEIISDEIDDNDQVLEILDSENTRNQQNST